MRARLGHDVSGPVGAPVLVLGSSLGTDRRMWDPQVDALCEQFRVIRYDHRGHGESQVPTGPYRIEDLGRDLLDLLDDLAVPQFAVGGLSLGAMVAMWVASQAPQRVRSLALFCTSAYLPPAQGWLDRASSVRAAGTESIADQVIGRWFTPQFATGRPALVAGLREQLLAVPDEGYAGCCEAIAGMDLRPLLATITAPTLVVAANSDEATPVQHAERIAAGIGAGCRVVTVPGAHLASVESAQRCTDLLLEHLAASKPAEGHR